MIRMSRMTIWDLGGVFEGFWELLAGDCRYLGLQSTEVAAILFWLIVESAEFCHIILSDGIDLMHYHQMNNSCSSGVIFSCLIVVVHCVLCCLRCVALRCVVLRWFIWSWLHDGCATPCVLPSRTSLCSCLEISRMRCWDENMISTHFSSRLVSSLLDFSIETLRPTSTKYAS